MSTCRSCAAPIHWVRLTSGKMHPCDPDPVSVEACAKGDKLVLDNGQIHVITGSENVSNMPRGYVSHFATCPDANEHRRVR